MKLTASRHRGKRAKGNIAVRFRLMLVLWDASQSFSNANLLPEVFSPGLDARFSVFRKCNLNTILGNVDGRVPGAM
jgi:hypothetical protein